MTDAPITLAPITLARDAVAWVEAVGRLSAAVIALVDLTGTGVQDTAIAALARDRAEAAGKGVTFES